MSNTGSSPQSKTAAEVFAFQRRIKTLSKADGATLLALLAKAGVSYRKRGNDELTAYAIKPTQFVVDLKK